MFLRFMKLLLTLCLFGLLVFFIVVGVIMSYFSWPHDIEEVAITDTITINGVVLEDKERAAQIVSFLNNRRHQWRKSLRLVPDLSIRAHLTFGKDKKFIINPRAIYTHKNNDELTHGLDKREMQELIELMGMNYDYWSSGKDLKDLMELRKFHEEYKAKHK